ncbi:MAG TPA: thymidine kinase [Aggregatilineales bacterium]|nr:thymidine kinase [Chloroflexota bacterium]HOA23758.1 thymidine kinase [Aggregatilineales bacterium]HQA69392.1 thymidine kinase [Aggregatilineales bacterium]HQE19343.1 thymidine kinase [Aggregatilineales bacterium]
MKHHRGRVEVICGSMFSGKSEELIRRVRRAEIARQNVQVFKPSLDNRYGEDSVNSHDGRAADAIAVERATDILTHLKPDTTVVAIDEAQFFDDGIVKLCRDLADQRGLRVIIAGLDLDFRGEPFGPMPHLMAQAEEVDKLHAICVRCGEEASRTQRIINGKPANYNDPIILVGATEAYEARCRHCHEVPGRP